MISKWTLLLHVVISNEELSSTVLLFTRTLLISNTASALFGHCQIKVLSTQVWTTLSMSLLLQNNYSIILATTTTTRTNHSQMFDLFLGGRQRWPCSRLLRLDGSDTLQSVTASLLTHSYTLLSACYTCNCPHHHKPWLLSSFPSYATHTDSLTAWFCHCRDRAFVLTTDIMSYNTWSFKI